MRHFAWWHDEARRLIGAYRCQSRRYGAISAALRYLGRKSPALWGTLGRVVTQREIARFLACRPPRILNLGGGGDVRDGIFTVDIDPRADAWVDITRALPFPSESVDHILCQEVVEHLSLPSAQKMIAECRRVLRAGGVLRVTTPDLDFFAELVRTNPQYDPLAVAHRVNSIFLGHQHQFIYSRAAMRELLTGSGFVVQESSYRDPLAALGYLDNHADAFNHDAIESQYWEATKPLTPSRVWATARFSNQACLHTLFQSLSHRERPLR